MKRVQFILSALLFLVLLAGCGSSQLTAGTHTPPPSPSVRPTDAAHPTPSLQPTDTPRPTPSVRPTNTPSPEPTATWVPTVTPRPATPTPAFSSELLKTMDAIEVEMEGLRGLEQTTPMTRTLMSRPELETYLEEEFAQDYAPEEIDRDVQVLAAFDFVSRDFDLLQVILDLYSSEVLGLYDDDLDTFYIITSGEFDLLNRLTYAHEYVHGLQDQNHGLDMFVDDDSLNDDEVLARLAVIEGDATLAMSDYLLAHISELTSEELASLLEGGDQGSKDAMNEVPPIIRETFSFPYVKGLDFVSLLREESWEAVDAAFLDPPQSTEQILHPEKYLTRDEPRIVALPPLTDTLGTGWHLVEAETLGEFQTGLYLAQQVDQETADLASEGWDGDQYAVYARDGEALLAFATVWDTTADRDEFTSAYIQYAESKFSQPAIDSSEFEHWWETPTQAAVLAWMDDEVLIIVGPDRVTVARALAMARR